MKMRSISITGAVLLILVYVIAVPSQLPAATLADWQFNEFGSGYVDPTAPYQSSYATVPGAPFAPVLNYAATTLGSDPRDLVRMRADNGLYNYQNSASYRTLSGTIPYLGYSGTPSYWGGYLYNDQRTLYCGGNGNDILTTRNPDAFSNSDLSGGFTAQVVWRPAIQSDPYVDWLANFDAAGNLKDNKSGFLFSIERLISVYYTDANASAGTVDPRLVFAINGTDSSSMVSVPFDGTYFASHPSWLEHTVAIYNPAGPNKLLLYRDGVLIATSATGTLGDLNTSTGFYAGETGVGSPPEYYAVSSKALIDQIVISSDVLIKTGDSTPLGWVIPEPSVALLSVVGCTLLLRRRR